MKKLKNKPNLITLLGILTAVVYWLTGSIIHITLINKEADLLHHLFSLKHMEYHEIWMAVTTLVIIFIFTAIAKKIVIDLNVAESRLREANNQLEIKLNERTAELKRQKKFTESLIQYSAVATFAINTDHKIVIWDKACEELTGKKASEMVGTDNQWMAFYDHKRPTVADIVVDNRTEEMAELYKTYSKSNLIPDGLHAEGWYANLGGKNRYIMFDAAPIYDHQGQLIAAVETLQDITSLKQAEESLEKSETKFRKLAESAAASIFIYDNAKFLYVNPTSEALTGYPANELLGMDFLNIVHTDFQGLLKTRAAARFKGEDVSPRYEFKIVRKDGEERWVDFTATLIEHEGKTAGLGTAYDITDKKKAEEQLVHAFSLLNATLESTADGILVVDRKGKITGYNQKFIDMWRIPPAIIEPGNDDVALAYVVEQLKAPEEFINKVIELYAAYDTESHDLIEFKDERIFERYSKPQKIDDTIVGRVWSFRDVTEYRTAEKGLIESEAKFRAITDSSPDALILISNDGIITYWNSAAERIFGYTIEEAFGKNVLFIIPGRYREAHTMGFNIFKETGQGAYIGKTYQVSAVKKDGMEVPIELSISAVKLKGLWNSAAIIRDISDRTRLEEQLRQSQKLEAVGQLAGGIAHDFNNILTAIIGYASLMDLKMSEKDPFKHGAKQIIASSERAAHLIKSLLAFSRKQKYMPRPADVNEIVKNVQKLLDRLIGEDVEFKVILAQEKLPVMADIGQIEQVLMNFATNARDAMPKGGAFAIETKAIEIDEKFIDGYGKGAVGKYALISVSDTGTGMDEKTKERIFEPFFTTKEVGKGTGLGLSMVYGIIKQHSGYINVYSEAGIGTTFKIYLPLIEHAHKEAEADILRASTPRGSETLLLVEDDKMVRTITKDILKEFGYTVIEAVDGKDGVDKFVQNKDKIKMIVLDVVMPKMNGWETYQEIKNIRPGIKALFLSGYTATIIQKQAGMEKDMDFISKPVSPNELLVRIREVMDRK